MSTEFKVAYPPRELSPIAIFSAVRSVVSIVN